MSSYSPFAASNDELTMLLLSPSLTSIDLAAPSHLPPLDDSLPTYRRRSLTTLGVLLGAHEDDTRCRYPSKLCRNTRVRKASGALHRYCIYHRDKANANQKRWVDRQREAVVSPTASSSSVSSPSTPSTPSSNVYGATKYRWILAASEKPTSKSSMKRDASDKHTESSTGAEILSDDDWEALLSLLLPSQECRPTSRCDHQRTAPHRRRASSSPMPPTYTRKGAY